MAPTPRPPLVAALAALALACAHPRPAPGSAELGATVIEVDPALVGKNAEELYVLGRAAEASGEDGRAAAAFGRLADLFPASPRAEDALRRAGLAEQRRGRVPEALARLEALVARGGPAADEGRLLAAGCAWQLGDRARAAALLEPLLARTDLPPTTALRAAAGRAVLELDDGRPAEAERRLTAALDAWAAAGERERLDPRDAAQARFALGEARRARFLAAPLDPSRAEGDALTAQLEEKSTLLLGAQDAYLEAVRAGDPAYVVAAGARVGDLYEAFRAQLLAAPLPPGLDAAQAAAYRAELDREVKVLAQKGVVAYEETLARARRAGVDNAYAEQAEAGLARLRAVVATPGS